MCVFSRSLRYFYNITGRLKSIVNDNQCNRNAFGLSYNDYIMWLWIERFSLILKQKAGKLATYAHGS